MVEKLITSPRTIIDLARYRDARAGARMPQLSLRLCRHCGAALAEGEREDECSGALNVVAGAAPPEPRRFVAE
ncbi:hypothetical protein [Bradyrhizobium sp. NP1]|uniref:hypothetical protein n=1 Tax=Bradyrhizobium sp. NP1 TaxID=3049772 RepID=UPI0025A5C29F|nr:hypothetical protein [Bradyrhizobium sp. NP1]WJR80257.1 hypothetical protein QOU61_11015 [Bradyrhizobium sp. NP1]